MKKLALAALLLLTACNEDTPAPPPTAVVTVSMAASSWYFQHSPGLGQPLVDQQGWEFDFPPQDGAHLLVQPVSGRMQGSKIGMTFEVQKTGDTEFMESNPCPPNPMNAQVRLFFQRRGDDLSGAGRYEFYRWWSVNSSSLSQALASPNLLLTPLQPSDWSSVMGKRGGADPAAFQAATQDVQFVGMTFGGCFFAHGVYVQGGTAKFIASGFIIQ